MLSSQHTGSRPLSPHSHSASHPVIKVSPSADLLPPMKRPFLHPSISRLRSITPQTSRTPSAGSIGTLTSARDETALSHSHSHLSALSANTSTANLHENNSAGSHSKPPDDREVFKWTRLKNIEDLIYGRQSSKAASILGTPSVGSPTVLVSNGLVCVGTDLGRILVFDFKQNLKCVCGDDQRGKL